MEGMLENMKKITNYLKNAKKIRSWIIQREKSRIPSQRAKKQSERTLANALNAIKRDVINVYMQLETEEQRDEYRKKYPEIDELLEIYNEIVELREKQKMDRENLRLQYAKEIREWLENNRWRKSPSIHSKDEEERILGIEYNKLREQLLNPYKKLQTEQEKEEFRKKHPHIDEILELLVINEKPINNCLKNVKLIKEWMEKNSLNKAPSQAAKDKEEKTYASALSNIRCKVKIYLELEKEEEREEFRAKFPEIEEIIEILQEIDNMIVPKLIRNARKIKEWSIKNGQKAPSLLSENPEERKLGIALNNIKMYRTKPYFALKTEQERIQFLKEYPDAQEIMDILGEMIQPREYAYLANAKSLKTWLEQTNQTRLPRCSYKNIDSEELKYGIMLNNIRQKRVAPFLKLNSEEERQAYRVKYPEIDEIMDIIKEITEKYGRKTLEQEVSKNIQKRHQLEKAIELEKDYEDLLTKKSNESNLQLEGVGVENDER